MGILLILTDSNSIILNKREGANMLNGKQRSYLKGLAHNLKPIIQMGKEGASESFIKQLDEMLEHKELVKVTIHDSAMVGAKEVANELAKELKAEFVQAIGSKLVLYREAKEEPEIKLPR